MHKFIVAAASAHSKLLLCLRTALLSTWSVVEQVSWKRSDINLLKGLWSLGGFGYFKVNQLACPSACILGLLIMWSSRAIVAADKTGIWFVYVRIFKIKKSDSAILHSFFSAIVLHHHHHANHVVYPKHENSNLTLILAFVITLFLFCFHCSVDLKFLTFINLSTQRKLTFSLFFSCISPWRSFPFFSLFLPLFIYLILLWGLIPLSSHIATGCQAAITVTSSLPTTPMGQSFAGAVRPPNIDTQTHWVNDAHKSKVVAHMKQTHTHTFVHSGSHQPMLNQRTKKHTHFSSGALISVPRYSPQFNGMWTHIHQTIRKGVYTKTHMHACTHTPAHAHTVCKSSKFQMHMRTHRPRMKTQRHKTEKHISTLYTSQPAGSDCTHTHTHTHMHTLVSSYFQFQDQDRLYCTTMKISFLFMLHYFSMNILFIFQYGRIWWHFFSWGTANNLNNLALKESQF